MADPWHELFGANMALLIATLAPMKGISLRINMLAGLLRGRTNWAATDLPSRSDRRYMTRLLALQYITGNLPEFNDALRHIRMLLMRPATLAEGRRQARELFRDRVRSWQALVMYAVAVAVLSSVASVVTKFAGHVPAATSFTMVSIGMLATVRALTEFAEGKRKVTEKGTFVWFDVTLKMQLACSIIILVRRVAWTDGSDIAYWLGVAGLVMAVAAGGAPVGWWLARNRYEGWRRNWVATLTLTGAVCGVLATVVELATYNGDLTLLILSAKVLGGLSLLGAAVVMAAVALEPPPPFTPELEPVSSSPPPPQT